MHLSLSLSLWSDSRLAARPLARALERGTNIGVGPRRGVLESAAHVVAADLSPAPLTCAGHLSSAGHLTCAGHLSSAGHLSLSSFDGAAAQACPGRVLCL